MQMVEFLPNTEILFYDRKSFNHLLPLLCNLSYDCMLQFIHKILKILKCSQES